MSLLQVRLRGKRYPSRQQAVLSALHLDLAAGEVLSLLGASGCGKSTLLRLLAGLDGDYEGELRLDGRALSGPSASIGMVFQEPRLFPWLSVAQNVGFESRRGFDQRRVSQLLEEVGLAGYEHAWPKQLSGGQAQRVAIARALYTRPRLLLLDEPFSALDAITRARLQDLVLRLAQAHGSSLLLVTHDVEEAVLLSDRVVVLAPAPGRVVFSRDIDLPRPRERHGPVLAQWRAELLDQLHAVSA